MGLFDWFDLEVKCPICNKKHFIDFQTKDIGCNYMRYVKGDYLSDMYNYIDCLGDCKNKLFRADVIIKKGFVTGKIKNIRKE